MYNTFLSTKFYAVSKVEEGDNILKYVNLTYGRTFVPSQKNKFMIYACTIFSTFKLIELERYLCTSTAGQVEKLSLEDEFPMINAPNIVGMVPYLSEVEPQKNAFIEYNIISVERKYSNKDHATQCTGELCLHTYLSTLQLTFGFVSKQTCLKHNIINLTILSLYLKPLF